MMESFAANNTTISTTPMSTSTTGAPDKPYPVFVGYICALIAVILYGSNFVPIKKFYTGDGVFFQWVLCSGIFLVGIVVQLIQGSEFYPLVMVGGAIWTTGNLCVVPIFKTIGMGLGLSIWGTCSLVVGWASGRFGWFDTKPDKISDSGMNYAGVALAFASILLYVMVKNEISGSTDIEIVVDEEDDPLLPAGSTRTINDIRGGSVQTSQDAEGLLVFNKSANSGNRPASGSISEEDDRMFIEDLSPNVKRIIGTVLSAFSGVMYGLNFMPSIYVQDHPKKYPGASQNGLDYVFAQFCGIYVTSSVYFYLYCAFKANKPKVYPKVILPGIASGIMWALATTCWFIANAELSEAVSFPIVSTGPSAIASLFWGVIVFHEIKGVRNILILLLAFCVMSAGAVLAGLSR